MLIAVTMFILSGCAFTDMESFKDPAFAKTKYRKIVVMARIGDLKNNKYAEDQFLKSFSKKDVDGISSMTLFPPTREVSAQEMSKTLNENQVEAVLIVALTDYWTDSYKMPDSSTTQGSGTIYGNSFQYSGTTTYQTGPTLHKPRAKFEVRLFDVRTDSVAWMASSFSKGNAYANINTIMDSLADKTVSSLSKEGLIREIEAKSSKTVSPDSGKKPQM
jgi:hypothetical protein